MCLNDVFGGAILRGYADVFFASVKTLRERWCMNSALDWMGKKLFLCVMRDLMKILPDE